MGNPRFSPATAEVPTYELVSRYLFATFSIIIKRLSSTITFTFRVSLSISEYDSSTRASCHLFLGVFISTRRRISPTIKFFFGLNHFFRCCNDCRKRFRHCDQNLFAKYCTRRHRFLEYTSDRLRLPGGGWTTLLFIVKILLGDNGERSTVFSVANAGY